MDITCPHCGTGILEGFNYCKACARRAVNFKVCDKCFEPLANDASSCPHCSFAFMSEKEIAVERLELEVRATHLGAFLAGGNFTGLFLPPIIKVCSGRITVTKWSFLGLRRHSQEIQVTRVASVRYTKGIFWGGLLVETFGGAAEDFCEKGLRQDDARTMAEQLKNCLQG